jgi:acetyltransferase-like isoleucine patch superfamily enzyme
LKKVAKSQIMSPLLRTAATSRFGCMAISTEIGKYTFVGPHVTIMPNTHIGKGSIVASHSMVKGTFPDFAIIGGIPAKVIGDTREMDEPYLNEHPELRTHYANWSKK